MRFRKLDMSLKDQRQALVDTFINSIYLYDDKVLITFNYKEGTQTITFEEAAQAASKENGSDLDCFTAPRIPDTLSCSGDSFCATGRIRTARPCAAGQAISPAGCCLARGSQRVGMSNKRITVHPGEMELPKNPRYTFVFWFFFFRCAGRIRVILFCFSSRCGTARL